MAATPVYSYVTNYDISTTNDSQFLGLDFDNGFTPLSFINSDDDVASVLLTVSYNINEVNTSLPYSFLYIYTNGYISTSSVVPSNKYTIDTTLSALWFFNADFDGAACSYKFIESNTKLLLKFSGYYYNYPTDNFEIHIIITNDGYIYVYYKTINVSLKYAQIGYTKANTSAYYLTTDGVTFNSTTPRNLTSLLQGKYVQFVSPKPAPWTISNKTVSDAPFTISGLSSTSPASITYTSSDSSIAYIVGTTVYVLNPGTATITASQPAITGFTSGSTSTTITVTSSSTPTTIPSITFSPITAFFGATPQTLSAISTSPGAFYYISSNPSIVSITGNQATILATGTVTITALQASSGIYYSAIQTTTMTITNPPPFGSSSGVGTIATGNLNSGTVDNNWTSITYGQVGGQGLYVAVAGSGTGNRVMTSPNGTEWTVQSSAADNNWNSVTYGQVNGQGLFVAVASSGTGNRVMTSPDGITWTIRTSAADNFWTSVAYGQVGGQGLFVAVAGSGTGNRVMTSPDGITWTSRTPAAALAWNSVTYGQGLFVAVSNSGTGNRVMTSPDGITWTSRTSAADIGWTSVTYGQGLFVAVSNSGTGNRVMTSPDGITWTSRTSAANNDWTSVTYGQGLFVAVAITGTGNRVMTSPDGITWTIRTSAANNNWTSVTYGQGLFVAVANSGTGNRVMTSPDGITWTRTITAANVGWYGVTYGNNIFVACGNSTFQNGVITSTDGINWVARSTPAANFWRSITYGNNLFVAVSTSGTGNRVMTSPDGINWTIRASASDSPWRSVTFGNGTFVAVADSGSNLIMTSTNGITWVGRNPPVNNAWRAVTYGQVNGQGLFVAVAGSGTGNRVMTSPDGITWTIRTSAADNFWYSVTYGQVNGQGLFVAVANTGTGNRVMTSPDGITWTSRAAADFQWLNVCYADGTFVAVAADGNQRIMTSSDGINWLLRYNLSYLTDFFGVAYGNNMVVGVSATGANGSPMLSRSYPQYIMLQTTTSITVPSTISKTLGDLPINLGATSNSPAPFLYSSSNTAVVTVDTTGLMRFVGVGTATITTSQASTTNFTSGTNVTTVTVSQTTSDNPLLIDSNEGLQYALSQSIPFIKLTSNIVLTSGLPLTNNGTNNIVLTSSAGCRITSSP